MADKKRIIFIMNPISGSARNAGFPDIIEQYLDKELYDYTIASTAYSGHAYEIAVRAKSEGCFAAVAVGGDGTQRSGAPPHAAPRPTPRRRDNQSRRSA